MSNNAFHTKMNIFTIPLLILRVQLSIADEFQCQDLNQVLLKNTNDKRKLHEVPALTLNNSLIPNAVQYAKKLASECTLYHDHGDFGENLFLARDPSIKLDKQDSDFGAIDAFYSEISCYCGYETQCPPCVYGHFTQLVWEESRSQGCGACMHSKSKCFVIACRYYPAGNMIGSYAANVKPPYGKQPPIWEVFQKATTKDITIAGAILAVFFGIVLFSFIMHFE